MKTNKSFDNINTTLSFSSAAIAVIQVCMQVPWYVYVISLGTICIVWMLVLSILLHRRPWDSKMCNPQIRRKSGTPYSYSTFFNAVYRKPFYESEFQSPLFSNKMNKAMYPDVDCSLLTFVIEDDPVGYADNVGMLPCIPVDDEVSDQNLYDRLVEIDSEIERYNFVFIATPSRRLESSKAFTLCKEIGTAIRRYHENYKAEKRVRIISKIDSCLRSNYDAEYDGITDGLGRRDCLEFLVPSYVEQGRVTLHGCQYIKANNEYILMHQSEYASFKGLEYANSDLAIWLEKRVHHIDSRKNVGLIDIDSLRTESSTEIVEKIFDAERRKIKTFVIDTIELGDIAAAAGVLQCLENKGKTLFLKFGPSMINYYASAYARPKEKNCLSHIRLNDCAIMIAGSLTSTTKKQIERFDDFDDTSIVTIKESDLDELHDIDQTITKRANNIIKKNRNGDSVILTTEYWKTDKNEYPDIHKRDMVLSLIAKICERIRESESRWFLFKGSDTALYSMIHGLNIRYFYYCGQYIPGVIHCKCMFRGDLKSFFIVGGNVGDHSLLKRLKAAILSEVEKETIL